MEKSWEVTVKFIVHAESAEDARDTAIEEMDAGEVCIGHNSFVSITPYREED